MIKPEKIKIKREAHQKAAYHIKRCIKALQKANIDQGIVELLQKYLSNWEIK